MIWLLFTLPPLLFFLPIRLQALLDLYRMGFNVPAQPHGAAELLELPGENGDLRGAGFTAIELLALL